MTQYEDGDLIVLSSMDASVLARIHAEAFAFPWSAKEVADLLRLDTVFGLKLVRDSVPVGFVLVQRVAEEAEILTIAVCPQARCRGVGRRILSAVLALAASGGADRVLLEVGAENRAARALYDGLGFTVSGRRHGYYSRAGGGREDALRMVCSVSTARVHDTRCPSPS